MTGSDASILIVSTAREALNLGYDVILDGIFNLRDYSLHNEPAGDQDVWHLHVHVFPRYEDDRLYLRHTEVTQLAPAKIEDLRLHHMGVRSALCEVRASLRPGVPSLRDTQEKLDVRWLSLMYGSALCLVIREARLRQPECA